jgi:low affinity Fe/Cu permease
MSILKLDYVLRQIEENEIIAFRAYEGSDKNKEIMCQGPLDPAVVRDRVKEYIGNMSGSEYITLKLIRGKFKEAKEDGYHVKCEVDPKPESNPGPVVIETKVAGEDLLGKTELQNIYKRMYQSEAKSDALDAENEALHAKVAALEKELDELIEEDPEDEEEEQTGGLDLEMEMINFLQEIRKSKKAKVAGPGPEEKQTPPEQKQVFSAVDDLRDLDPDFDKHIILLSKAAKEDPELYKFFTNKLQDYDD